MPENPSTGMSMVVGIGCIVLCCVVLILAVFGLSASGDKSSSSDSEDRPISGHLVSESACLADLDDFVEIARLSDGGHKTEAARKLMQLEYNGKAMTLPSGQEISIISSHSSLGLSLVKPIKDGDNYPCYVSTERVGR
jgi:hypothetical protein